MEQEKKYLKTIEEVSDALAAGKVVYDENGSSFWLDKNGIVVSESESFGPCVGAMVDLTVENYILEPKPLEVKLWHLYEDNRGKKVFIHSYNKNYKKYPFLGVREDCCLTDCYDKQGNCMNDDSDGKLVKELADLSKYFEKENDNEKIS